MIVDMHHHAVPPEAVARLRRDPGRYGCRFEDTPSGPVLTFLDGWGRPLPISGRMTDLVERKAHLREIGADGAVISVWIDFHRYRMDPRRGQELAAMLNDTLAEWLRAEPRLRAMATLPLQDGEAAARELARAKADLAMPGAMIMTHVGDANLDDPGLEPLWTAAESLRTPLFLHPTDVAGKDRLGCYFLENLLGNPFETTIAAATLIMSGVLDRHPDLEIVLAHGGGYLSLATGRLSHGFSHNPAVDFPAESPPEAYLRRFYYDTILYRPEAVAHLANLVGRDRLLFGTDYPFTMEMEDPLRTLRGLGFDDAALGRAAEVYGFGGSD